MKPLIAIAVAFLLSGCTLKERVAELTLKDAQAAKARAIRGNDKAGERCWEYVELQLLNDALSVDIDGIMDAVQAARLIRLQSPDKRKELMAGCGEVFADVMVELAKRGAKRGL